MIGLLFYKTVSLFCRVLTRRVAGSLAGKIGIFDFYASKRKRNAVLSNMRWILGKDSTESEVRRKAKEVFANFGWFLVDFFRFRDLATFKLSDWLDEASAAKMKDLCSDLERTLFVSGHVGNWEMGPAAVASVGSRIAVIAQDHPDIRVTEYFNDKRSKLGADVISLSNPVLGMLRTLRAGNNMAILGDRDFPGTGEFFEFMGGRARFPTGYAVLAFEADAVLLPAFLVRQENGKYCFFTAEKFKAKMTGDRVADVKESVQRYLEFLETIVRDNLTQWFIFEPLWEEETN